MTYERPNVKLIFETRNDITDLIISTYLECYREANKPANAVQKKNNFRQNAPSGQPETKSIGSKISKVLGGGDKNKEITRVWCYFVYARWQNCELRLGKINVQFFRN